MRTRNQNIPISWRIASLQTRWHGWRCRRLRERAREHEDRGVLRQAAAIAKRPA